MNELCKRLIRECGEPVFGLVLLDIDFFLRYCVRFSAEECDQIWDKMRAFVASAFGGRAVCRSTAGDEMAVLLPGMTKEQAVKRTDEVRKSFRRQNFLPDSLAKYAPLRMSFSAGVTACPQDDTDPDRLSRLAVSALFLAKAGRRNQVASLDLSQREAAEERRLWDERLSVQTVLGSWGRVGRVTVPIRGRDALLFEPQAIAADELGRLYVADTDNHQVVRLDGDRVYPVAGCGEFGYTGDGGPALKARLNKPTAIWVRWQRLYIADTGNDVIREVNLRGEKFIPWQAAAVPGIPGTAARRQRRG